MTTEQILADLKAMGNAEFKAGLGRFKINQSTALGIRVPALRQYARNYRKAHQLALALWETKVHEARLLAIFMADPKQLTLSTIEQWVGEFNSWDICDQACGCLLVKTPFAWDKAREWARRSAEFEKRAGFALVAYLAIHDKKAPDEAFLQFFPFIREAAQDNRNFVKKAVNWALRQVGKRNLVLNNAAIALAREIQMQEGKSARWIAADALKELESTPVQERLQKKREAKVKF